MCTKLRDYHGRLLEIQGGTWVSTQYEGQKRKLPLVIVTGNRPALLGRNWLKEIQLNWPKICTIDVNRRVLTQDLEVEKIIERHRSAFAEGHSVIKDFKATFETGS
jgi:hypothetical protein